MFLLGGMDGGGGDCAVLEQQVVDEEKGSWRTMCATDL